MNAASWRKAADMAVQQAAAITDSKKLETLPLSQLSVDNSGPPQVNYGIDNPLAVSTPRTSAAPQVSTTNTESEPGDNKQTIPLICHR